MVTRGIAAQLYTLREFLTTPKDIAATLKRVRALGYNAVQLSALGPIDLRELASILDGEGLTCAATHESVERLLNELPAVVDEHRLRSRLRHRPRTRYNLTCECANALQYPFGGWMP